MMNVLEKRIAELEGSEKSLKLAIVAELAYRDKRIDKLEVELAAYTTAEINDLTTWPTIERQRARIKGLEARLNYESLLTEDERTTRLQLKEENEHLRKVKDAAACIQHWHDSGEDGMVVSAEHVRKLWAALDAAREGSDGNNTKHIRRYTDNHKRTDDQAKNG